ncbi:GDSL-like Lipase/Acylhydrolase family protein [Arthrobacter sp. VKM Ac-2550]|nr:GDSL-like Lipase/Acylhydrolase family protein [Arthrobacter sp. VKM Ac-2550]
MNANFHGRTGLTKRLGALTVLVAGLVAGSVAAPAVAHEDSVDLVVLGDSYSAGIGAGTLMDSTVLPGANCGITDSGYAEALEERRDAVNATNAACSGAKALVDIDDDPDVPDVPDQILAATDDLGEHTDLVAITAGGNDVSFGTIIYACAKLTLKDCNDAVAGAVFVAEKQVAPALEKDYKLIRNEAPDATIVALGYPHLFSTEGATASPLSPEAAKVFNDGVDTLNTIIERTAEDSGSKVDYVDVTKRFRNHGIGSSEPWVNFDPTNLQHPNNFHPNEKGYENGYAKVLKPVVRSLRH